MSSKKPPKILNLVALAHACIESGNFRSTFHAKLRQTERHITLLDATYVIKNGYRIAKRDQYKEEWRAWNYAFEGKTLQDETIRVIISFDKDLMLIITVIKIEKGK